MYSLAYRLRVIRRVVSLRIERSAQPNRWPIAQIGFCLYPTAKKSPRQQNQILKTTPARFTPWARWKVLRIQTTLDWIAECKKLRVPLTQALAGWNIPTICHSPLKHRPFTHPITTLFQHKRQSILVSILVCPMTFGRKFSRPKELKICMIGKLNVWTKLWKPMQIFSIPYPRLVIRQLIHFNTLF